jgi:hypothetical protein
MKLRKATSLPSVRPARTQPAAGCLMERRTATSRPSVRLARTLSGDWAMPPWQSPATPATSPAMPAPSLGCRGPRTRTIGARARRTMRCAGHGRAGACTVPPRLRKEEVLSTDGSDRSAAPVRRSRRPRRWHACACPPAPRRRGIPSWPARGTRPRAYRPHYPLPVGVWGQAEIAPQGATDVEPPGPSPGTARVFVMSVTGLDERARQRSGATTQRASEDREGQQR